MKIVYVRHNISVQHSLEKKGSFIYSNILFLLKEGNITREMELILAHPVESCNSTAVFLNYTYGIKKSYLLGK